MERSYYVYIVTNRHHRTVYTGVTSDLEARVWQHQNRFYKGSFTERYNCDKLFWYELHEDIDVAIQREKRVKDWHRLWKDRLIEAMNPDWRDLSKVAFG